MSSPDIFRIEWPHCNVYIDHFLPVENTCSRGGKPSTAEQNYPWAAAFYHYDDFQCIGHLSEY